MLKKLFYVLLPILVAVILLGGLAIPVQAAEFDHDGRLEAGQVVDDDLFITAQDVVVDGTVNGILFAGGNTVTINGKVNGDVIAVGSNVVVSDTAEINGNLFTAAQTVTVSGKVTGSVAAGCAAMTIQKATTGHNLYFGGYSLKVEPGVKIDRGLYAGAYQVMLNGEVTRNVSIGAGAVEIGGQIGGDANVNLGEVNTSQAGPQPFFGPMSVEMPPTLKPGLRISPTAKIAGKLNYISSVDMRSSIQSEPVGGIVFQTPVPKAEPEASPTKRTGSWFLQAFLRWLWRVVRTFITLLLLGLLAVAVIPRLMQNSAQQARTKPLPSAGYGLLTLIVGYVGAFIVGIVILVVGILLSVVTLGGLSRAIFGIGFSSLAVFVSALTLLVAYGGTLVIAYLAGDWILGKLAPQANGRRFWAIVAGVIAYTILYAIPVLGWLVWFVTALLGLGAMWLLYQNWRKPAVVVPAPVAPDAPAS